MDRRAATQEADEPTKGRVCRKMSLIQIVILAVVQGLTELLPVSSSAHVVVAEKLMGIDASSPEATLLLVMLHTGTMVAVIMYFWADWRRVFFGNAAESKRMGFLLALATVTTGIVGLGMIRFIEGVGLRGTKEAEVEQLFGRLELIAPALALAGILIVVAGFVERRRCLSGPNEGRLNGRRALFIGAVQGLCLPFRGFSRSGVTISVGMLAQLSKSRAEQFSFALAVLLTPPVVVREMLRLIEATRQSGAPVVASAVYSGLVGACCAFVAGWLALKWLSRWLESGKWYVFGVYCLIAAGVVMALHGSGY